MQHPQHMMQPPLGGGDQYAQAGMPPVQYAQAQAQAQVQAQAAQQQQQQQNQLQVFWQQQMQEVETASDFNNHMLPLARIKKIMKSDEEVRMIASESPVVFAKACEMFILELTLRSWSHAEENKRRTLQRNDIAAAITKTDIFDFLVDIVPRDDLKEDMGPGMAHTQHHAGLPQGRAPGLPTDPSALGGYSMPPMYYPMQHGQQPGMMPHPHAAQLQASQVNPHLMYGTQPGHMGMPPQQM